MVSPPQELCGERESALNGHRAWEVTQTKERALHLLGGLSSTQHPAFYLADLFPTLHGHKSDKCWGSEDSGSPCDKKKLQKCTVL